MDWYATRSMRILQRMDTTTSPRIRIRTIEAGSAEVRDEASGRLLGRVRRDDTTGFWRAYLPGCSTRLPIPSGHSRGAAAHGLADYRAR